MLCLSRRSSLPVKAAHAGAHWMHVRWISLITSDCLLAAVQVPLWQSWLLQVAVGLRTRVVHQPYGDQALFVRKSTLQELGVSLF
jgi:hypothetical protein